MSCTHNHSVKYCHIMSRSSGAGEVGGLTCLSRSVCGVWGHCMRRTTPYISLLGKGFGM